MNDSIISKRKYYKRNKVLDIIRSADEVSRFDVKKATRYSITTVQSIISDLIEKGLVYEEECQDARVGRKPVWLHINQKGAYFIGIEFNVDYMYCALLNMAGEVCFSELAVLRDKKTQPEIMHALFACVDTALKQVPDDAGKVYGIGVGVPGYIDKKKGIAISYSHFHDWSNVPIVRLLEERYPFACYMDNNVNVMAFAYLRSSVSQKLADTIFVSIRSGIRMVPIMGGRPVFSLHGFSGELGHTKVAGSNRLCACGKRGCLNAEASDVNVLQMVAQGAAHQKFAELVQMADGNVEKIDMPLLCASIGRGHEDSVLLMRHVARVLGESLGTMINIFAPETIVVSGGLANAEGFIEELNRVAKRHVVKENLPYLHIEACSYGPNIGAIGAAMLVMQQEFELIDKDI